MLAKSESPRHPHHAWSPRSWNVRRKSSSEPTTPRDGLRFVRKTRSGGSASENSTNSDSSDDLTKSDGARTRVSPPPRKVSNPYAIDLAGDIYIAHTRHEKLPACVLPQLLGLLRERGIGCEVHTSNTGSYVVIPSEPCGKIKLKYIKRVSVPQLALDGVAAMCAQPNQIFKFCV